MAAVSPKQVTHLYRSLLRTSSKFANYNFREHSKRRTRDLFHAHKSETDPAKIAELVQKASKELKTLQRQTIISQFYQLDRTVVEGVEGKDKGAHGGTMRVKDVGWD